MENIPKENCKALETYLNEARASGKNYVRLPIVARESDVDEQTALDVLTYLCDEGIIQAKLKVRCPECNSQHGGVFDRQSDVPDKTEHCMCGAQFEMDNKRNWEVVYEIPDEDFDFFLDVHDRLRRFQESARNLTPTYFQNEFEELTELGDPHARGRYFDHFVGLLFCQLDGVSVQVKDNRSEGEVDVVVSCYDSEWLYRIIGNATVIENKWQADGATQGDANQFKAKAEEVAGRTLCRTTYFVSVEGFTSDAEESLSRTQDPVIVMFDREDIQQMIEDGSPESAIKTNVL